MMVSAALLGTGVMRGLVGHFFHLLPLAGLLLEQRKAAHAAPRALPTICWLTQPNLG